MRSGRCWNITVKACIDGKIVLTTSQVAAIKIMLNKLLPDLKAIEHSGNPDHPVITEIRRVIIDPKCPVTAQSQLDDPSRKVH
jgi:hypothetical protein